MKNVVTLFMLLLLASGSGLVDANCNTYITNRSSRTLIATILYEDGHSKFTNRVIAPQTYQGDTYTTDVEYVNINLSVQGNRVAAVETVKIQADRSVVAYDSLDMKQVFIFYAKYRTLEVAEGSALVSINVRYPS
ncbi:hypothetical protein Mapa_015796 [Marchantia paleacea]|nr:hypothetical protein Mapa_015796 [Marchantia paleacea]